MDNKTKIVLAGDGWGAVSAAISLKKYFQNVFVLTNDESIIALFPKERKISNFESIYYDYVICAGYKPFIKKQFTDTGRFINIHYSLLPTYRGLHSTVWAILNNERTLGLTIHLMNEYMDDGSIIHQFSIENDHVSTSVDYMKQFNDYIKTNLGEIILKFINNDIEVINQDKSLASWVGKRNIEDCRIDFTKSISYQKAFFRALVEPYPVPFFEYNNEVLYPKSVCFHKSNIETHIGRILNIDNEGIWIKVLDGYMVCNSIANVKGDIINNSIFKIGKYIK